MSKLQQFTPAVLKTLRPQIQAGLKELGDRLGIEFHAGNASYDTLTAHIKLNMTLVGDVEGLSPQEIEDKKLRAEFEEFAGLFGLTADDYAMMVTVHGEEFELVGFNLKARKNQFTGRDKRGKKYRLPTAEVEHQIKKAS